MRRTKHGSGLGQWRWVVERTFAWLNQFRRLRVRYDKRADIHQASLSRLCVDLLAVAPQGLDDGLNGLLDPSGGRKDKHCATTRDQTALRPALALRYAGGLIADPEICIPTNIQ